MGHIFMEQGIPPADPAKIEAIAKMSQPKDIEALQRFLGMVNYLTSFCSELYRAPSSQFDTQ